MSDKEFLESEEEGTCPSYFWYLIASFALTAIIVVILIAYLIMYSDHFMWALRRNPKPVRATKSEIENI
uniref:Col_cuticle_N domain-containing protein n=1 Tax=Elaeophora elaphi TaxID=1147741 RepID=A0A0R3S239_9BILA